MRLFTQRSPANRPAERRVTVHDVDLGYACYWIESEDDIVTKAPPIARWMVGERLPVVIRWIERKGGTVVRG